MAQQLAALYRVHHEAQCSAGEGTHEATDTVGFASWRCSDCTPAEQEERGCWIEGRSLVALTPTRIDYTGDESHDWIRVCPRSLRSISLEALIARLPALDVSGGPHSYYGTPLGDLPTRVVWSVTAVMRTRDRYQAQVRDAQRRCEGEALESEIESRRRTGGV